METKNEVKLIDALDEIENVSSNMKAISDMLFLMSESQVTSESDVFSYLGKALNDNYKKLELANQIISQLNEKEQ